eukprot:11605925-Alexandrium_andersonii.AAC.1
MERHQRVGHQICCGEAALRGGGPGADSTELYGDRSRGGGGHDRAHQGGPQEATQGRGAHRHREARQPLQARGADPSA